MQEAESGYPTLRGARALLAAGLAIWIATGAATAADLEARVEPPEVRAGEVARLVLVVRDEGPAEAWVFPEIACDVATPLGRVDTPCAGAGALAEVRVLGTGAREFAFMYDGADDAGSYEVTFRVESALAIPTAQMMADTTFAVAGEPLEESEAILDAPDASAPQWIASALGATAAGTVTIASALSSRRGL